MRLDGDAMCGVGESLMTRRTTETPMGNGIVGRVTLLWHRLQDVAVPLIAVCCPLVQPSAQQNGSAVRTNPTIDSTITARTRRTVTDYSERHALREKGYRNVNAKD